MLHQRDNLSNDVIDVERRFLDVVFLRERPDAPHNLTRPVAVVYYPFRRAARCVQVGNFTAKPLQTGLGVRDDGSERLAHFMSDGSRQFAQHRHARYVCEFHPRFSERLFSVICTDYRSNVGAGASIAEEISLFVENRLAACSDICRRSALAQEAIDEITKWLMRVKHLPMQSPFFGFGFYVV